MDIGIKCYKIEGKYKPSKGMLRCVEEFAFYIPYDTEDILIAICEMGDRTITISCKNEVEVTRLYSILLNVERLLQIFDGTFVPLEKISIFGNDSENYYKSFETHLIAQRLRYFDPADLLSVQSDRLLDYESVLSAKLYDRWCTLLDELGVVNQMYLYATSNSGFTNDVKCSFLIELAESLIEVIGKESIVIQSMPNERGNELKVYLRTLIKIYGKILFESEIQYDFEKILECLVNTRVNIMHIKLHQRKPAFDGKESSLYMIKMSYLYRIVVLSKLGIGELDFGETLKERVNRLNEWNGIQKHLFQRLRTGDS